jgi:ketosteroid isomerase-like protein
MSQENVELAHRAYDAVNGRDLDAFLALMDADVEAMSRIVAMEGGLHGLEGARRWWDNWFAAFPDYRLEVVGEVRDLGEVTLAALRAVGHGAGSEVPFEDAIWHACRWRDGKIVWWQVFYTESEARKGAGLRE